MSFVNQLKGLGNLKIGGRIALALMVPALGLLAFGGMLLIEKRHAATNMADVERLATLAPVISGLVHEMQKERGASAGFLASKGAKFGDTLKKQRLDTNAKNVVFAKALDAFDASLYPPVFPLCGLSIAIFRIRATSSTTGPETLLLKKDFCPSLA